MATGPVAPAKTDAGLWDAVRRILEGRKKTVLLGLLSQMRGELQEGEFVISCGHEMMLDRLKEKDKWDPFLSALEEAAGRAVPRPRPRRGDARPCPPGPPHAPAAADSPAWPGIPRRRGRSCARRPD